MVGQDSSVGVANRYGLDGPGIESNWARFYAPVQTCRGTHAASYTMDIWSFPEVKRPERDMITHLHTAPKLQKERPGSGMTTHPHTAPKLKKERPERDMTTHPHTAPKLKSGRGVA